MSSTSVKSIKQASPFNETIRVRIQDARAALDAAEQLIGTSDHLALQNSLTRVIRQAESGIETVTQLRRGYK
jgi:hypothetical protein